MKELFDALRQSGGELMTVKLLGANDDLMGVIVVAEGETAKVLARAADAISDGADPVPESE